VGSASAGRRVWLLVIATAVVTALLVGPISAWAAVSFTDVGDANVFKADIEWMADTGVTKGCNAAGTLFCPKDEVTREQMAAFMHRLSDHISTESGAAYSTYYDSLFLPPTGDLYEVLALDVPAGSYFATAKTTVSNNDFSNTSGECYLTTDTDFDHVRFDLGALGLTPPKYLPISLEVVHTFDAPGRFRLLCGGSPHRIAVEDMKITALSVASVSNVNGE
jgi:hypothetical protein